MNGGIVFVLVAWNGLCLFRCSSWLGRTPGSVSSEQQAVCGMRTYLRLLRLLRSHSIPSKEQFIHGGPERSRLHRTLRSWQLRHATVDRFLIISRDIESTWMILACRKFRRTKRKVSSYQARLIPANSQQGSASASGLRLEVTAHLTHWRRIRRGLTDVRSRSRGSCAGNGE